MVKIKHDLPLILIHARAKLSFPRFVCVCPKTTDPPSCPSFFNQSLVESPTFRISSFNVVSSFDHVTRICGMLQNAISTFGNLEKLGIERCVKSLNSLIFTCILAKNYDEARRVFVDFPKRYELTPDLDTYNHMLKAFSESGSSSSGYSIVAKMEKAGCKPKATTFGSLIEGFYVEKKFEEVGKVLKMMEERTMKPGLSRRSLCGARIF